jgi:GNAT superfamily N-acetyltransferase
MTIRPAEEKDRTVLSSLHISEDLESHKEAPDVMTSFRLSGLSSRGKDVILVAEDDGEAVGYLWAVALRIFDYRIGVLFDVYVDPSHRRKGVGRHLLEKGVQELRDIGVRRFWANTEEKNAPTRALLEHLGFRQNNEKVFYQKIEPGARHEWEKA